MDEKQLGLACSEVDKQCGKASVGNMMIPHVQSEERDMNACILWGWTISSIVEQEE